MNELRMAKILKQEYSLSELEERFGIEPKDLEYGLDTYVDEHYEDVLEVLREDLWFD